MTDLGWEVYYIIGHKGVVKKLMLLRVQMLGYISCLYVF